MSRLNSLSAMHSSYGRMPTQGLDCVRLRDGPAGYSHPFPNWRRWGGPDRRGSIPRRPSGDRSSSGHPPPTTGGRGGARLRLFAVFDVQLVQHDLAVIALVARVGLLAVRLGVGAGLEVGLRRVGFHRRLQFAVVVGLDLSVRGDELGLEDRAELVVVGDQVV